MAKKKELPMEAPEVKETAEATAELDISERLNAAHDKMMQVHEEGKAKKEEQEKLLKQADAEAKRRGAEAKKQRQDAEKQAKAVAERKLAEFTYAENYRKKLIKDKERHVSASKQKELQKKAEAAAREREEREQMIAEMLEAERRELEERAARADAALERTARVAMDMVEAANAARAAAEEAEQQVNEAPAPEKAPEAVAAAAQASAAEYDEQTVSLNTADDGMKLSFDANLGKDGKISIKKVDSADELTLRIPEIKVENNKTEAPKTSSAAPMKRSGNPFADVFSGNPFAGMQNPYAQNPHFASVANDEGAAAEGEKTDTSADMPLPQECADAAAEQTSSVAEEVVIPAAVIRASRKEEKQLQKAKKQAAKAEKKAEKAAKLAEREEREAEMLAAVAAEQAEKKSKRAAKKADKKAQKQAKIAERAEKEAREAEQELEKYNAIVEKAAAKRDKKRAAKQAKIDKKLAKKHPELVAAVLVKEEPAPVEPAAAELAVNNEALMTAEEKAEAALKAAKEAETLAKEAKEALKGLSEEKVTEPITAENVDKAYDMEAIGNDIRIVNLPSLPAHIKASDRAVKKLEKSAERTEKSIKKAKDNSAKIEYTVALLGIYKEIIDTLCENLKCCVLMGTKKYNKSISKKIKKAIAKYNKTVDAYEALTGDTATITRLDLSVIENVLSGGAYEPIPNVTYTKTVKTIDEAAESEDEIRVARRITESEKKLAEKIKNAEKKMKSAKGEDALKLAALADAIVASRDLVELLCFEMKSAVARGNTKDIAKYKQSLASAAQKYNELVNQYEELTGAALARTPDNLIEELEAGRGYQPLPEMSYTEEAAALIGKRESKKERKARLRALKNAQSEPQSRRQLTPYLNANDKKIEKLDNTIKRNDKLLKKQTSAVDFNRMTLNGIKLKGDVVALVRDNLIASYRLGAERQTKLYKNRLIASVEAYNLAVNAYHAVTGAKLIKISPTLADDITSGRSYQATPTLEWRERFIELRDKSQAMGDEQLVFVFPKVADIEDGQSAAAETYVYNVDFTTTPLVTDRIVETPVNTDKLFAKLKIRNKRGMKRYDKAAKHAEHIVRAELEHTKKQIAKSQGFSKTKFAVKRLILVRQLIDISIDGLKYAVSFGDKKRTLKYKNACIADMIDYNSYVEMYITETEQMLTPASAFVPYDIIEGRDYEPMPIIAYRKEFVERNGDSVRVVDAIGKNGAVAAMEAHREASDAYYEAANGGAVVVTSPAREQSRTNKSRENRGSSDTDESAGHTLYANSQNSIIDAEEPMGAKAKRAAKAARKAEAKARAAEERAAEKLAIAEAKRDSKRLAERARRAEKYAEKADDKAAIREERAIAARDAEDVSAILNSSYLPMMNDAVEDVIIPTRSILDDVRANHAAYEFDNPKNPISKPTAHESRASRAATQAQNNARMADYYAGVAEGYQIDASYCAELAEYSAAMALNSQTKAENFAGVAEYFASMAKHAADKAEYSALTAQYHEDSANISAIKADNSLSMATYYAGKAANAQSKAAYVAKQAENYAQNTELYAQYVADITSRAEDSQRLADISMLQVQDTMNRPHALTVATATSAAISGTVNKVLDKRGLQIYAASHERNATRHYRRYTSLNARIKRVRGNDKIVCLLDAVTECKARIDIYIELLKQSKRSVDANPQKSREIDKYKNAFAKKLAAAITDYNELVKKYTELSAKVIPTASPDIPKLILEGKKYDQIPDITYKREFTKPGGENLVILNPGVVVDTVVDTETFSNRSELIDKIHSQIDVDTDAVSNRFIYDVNLKERTQNIKSQYQFGIDTSRVKATRKATVKAVNRLKKEHKEALRLEKLDNQRYYDVVKTNPMLIKVKDEGDRNRLALLREEIILLLDKRNEINAELVAMYTGTDVDPKGEPVNMKYEKIRLKAAGRAYSKRMRKYGEIKHWKIGDKYKQRVFDLMNREVETIADIEQLKARINKQKLTRRQRKLIRKDIRSKEKYLKLLKKKRSGAFGRALEMHDDVMFMREVGLWALFVTVLVACAAIALFWEPIMTWLSGWLSK